MTKEIFNELEQIYLLLKSPDIETKKLGRTLFFRSSFIKQYKGKLNKLYFINFASLAFPEYKSYRWYQYNPYYIEPLVYGLLNNTVSIKTN